MRKKILLFIDIFCVFYLSDIAISEGNYIIRTSSEYAIKETAFNLTCNTGSPPNFSAIFWYRNVNGNILQETENCSGSDVGSKQNLSNRYSYYCPNESEFILVIPANYINGENGVTWNCATISGQQPSKRFTIRVFEEPRRNVTLIGYDGAVLYPDQNITLICSSYGGYPLANLTWKCGGNRMVGSDNSTEKKYISSMLNLHITNNSSGLNCTCMASHPLWEDPITKQSLPLLVYYASSEKPKITGYESFQAIREGDNVTLTCTVSGGFPLTILSWICDGNVYNAENLSTSGLAKSVLTLSINRTYNEKQCICYGTSMANYSGTSNVTFNVHYPPRVNLTSMEEQLTNSTVYHMYCLADDGNPSSYAFSWSHSVAHTVVRTNADLSSFQTNNEQNLTITADAYDDYGMYTCSVQNNVTDRNGNLLQENKTVSINKSFSAVFTKTNIFNAVKDKLYEVKIPFYCKPAANSTKDLRWIKEDKNNGLNVGTSGLSFHLTKTKVEVPFYGKFIKVPGQLAVMKIGVFTNRYAGKYILHVLNMPNVSSEFHFEIKQRGTETNETVKPVPKEPDKLLLIIGCSVGGVVLVVLIVVMVVCMARKCSNNKDTEETRRLKKDARGKKNKYRISSVLDNPYAEINETCAASNSGTNQSANNESMKVNAKDSIPMAMVSPYAVSGAIKPVKVDNGYAEVSIGAKPTTENTGTEIPGSKPSNSQIQPPPIYAEVQKPKKDAVSDKTIKLDHDSGKSQKEHDQNVKKPEPVYAEVNKPKRNVTNGDSIRETNKMQANKDVVDSEKSTDLDAEQLHNSSEARSNSKAESSALPDKENGQKETEGRLNYADLELEQQAAPHVVIKAEGSGVEYAEIK